MFLKSLNRRENSQNNFTVQDKGQKNYASETLYYYERD